MFFRRLSSHLIITCAVFCLVATYFIWVIDATFLNAAALNKALVSSGVPSAIATTLPDTLDTGENGQKPDAEMKAKIAQVVTPAYVEHKIKEVTTSLITFVRNGQPQPVVELTDFPTQIREAGIEMNEEEAAKFDKPIELNQSGSLDKLPKYYQTFELAKYFGIMLFLILLGVEWLVAEKGKKLRRIGRVFLHAGIWFAIFWASTVFIPSRVLKQLNKDPNAGSVQKVGAAVVDTLQSLLTPQLLGAAIVCLVFAAIIYVLRHGKKHLDTIQEVPTARIRSSAMAKMPTRH